MANLTLRRSLLSSSFALAVLAAPSIASAAVLDRAPDVDHDGTFLLSAERLFGVSYSTESLPNNQSNSSTSINLVGNYLGQTLDPWAASRLGLDYVVASHITIGGSVGYAHFSTSSNDGSTSTDNGSFSEFVLSPRVGYLVDLGPVDLWLRAGITYGYASTSPPSGSTDSSTSWSGLDLDLEPRLLAEITDHFGFYGGLSFDFALTGSESQSANGTSVSSDDKISHYGLDFGLTGWF
jgi:hypothetical protein